MAVRPVRNMWDNPQKIILLIAMILTPLVCNPLYWPSTWNKDDPEIARRIFQGMRRIQVIFTTVLRLEQ